MWAPWLRRSRGWEVLVSRRAWLLVGLEVGYLEFQLEGGSINKKPGIVMSIKAN